MPTYEYHCTTCDARWEAEQRISDPPFQRCGSCLEETARRLISGGGGFQLKGGGWFADGYVKPK